MVDETGKLREDAQEGPTTIEEKMEVDSKTVAGVAEEVLGILNTGTGKLQEAAAGLAEERGTKGDQEIGAHSKGMTE